MTNRYEAMVTRHVGDSESHYCATLKAARAWLRQWLDDPDVYHLSIHDHLRDEQVFGECVSDPC